MFPMGGMVELCPGNRILVERPSLDLDSHVK